MESLSRPPHRRKHSTATDASSSLKNPYEGVFLSRRGKAKFQPHEYAEIFSGSSSIPVLDLSGLNEPARNAGCRSSELDYSNIFGGANADDVAVPYDHLFNGVKKNKTRKPADTAVQERGSVNSSGKKANRSSGEHGQSTDGIKQQFNMSFNKTSQRSSDESNGKTHVAQLHAVPGFAYFVDGTPQLQKKESDRSVPSMKRDVSRIWSFSSGIEAISVEGGVCSEKSHTPDKPQNVNGINVKSNISKVQPPLGHCSGPNEMDIKQSGLPSFGSKDASKETTENPPPVFDEELDENSDAAVSVAALKKAIEQAQESIRLAKMIMQRKREGVIYGSRSRRSGDRLKVEDKKENRVEHVSGCLKEKNVTEKSQGLDPRFFNVVDGKSSPTASCSDNLLNGGMSKVETIRENFEAANGHGDAFSEPDKKFARSCNQSESLNTDNNVEEENIRQNVAVSEAHGETINSTGLVANVVLDRKVDSSDNLICSKSNAEATPEHMESDKRRSLEQIEFTMHQSKYPELFSAMADSVASTSQSVKELEETSNDEAVKKFQETVGGIKGSLDLSEQLERVLECSGSMQEQEKITHEGDQHLRINQESEPPEGSDSTADREKSAKKFVGDKELNFSENSEMPRLDFNILQNESPSMAKKNMMNQADIDKKAENICVCNEDDQDGKFVDEYENEMVNKEQIQWFESEPQLEEPVEEALSEREPGSFSGVREAANKVGMVLGPEIDVESLNLEHEEGSQTIPGEFEENEIAVCCIDAAECEAVNTLQVGGTDNYYEVQNGKIYSDVEEVEREEDQDKFEFQDSASEEETSEAFDPHFKDSGTIFSDEHGINTRTVFTETPETCNDDLNHKTEKHQAVLRACKENSSLPQETEIYLPVEENEGGNNLLLDLNKISGTDSFSRCASLEKFTESQLNSSSEGFTWDRMSTSVILTNEDHERTPQKDEHTFETTIEVHNAAQENAANANMQNFPELHVSTNSEVENFDKTNAKPDSQQNSENREESQLPSTLENTDDVSAHEPPAFRENAEDISSDKEEVNGDLDMNSDEREHVGKQSGCVNSEDQSHLSQTNCEPKEMDKSVEAEREIKSGQSVENIGREQQDAKGSEQKREIDDDQMQRIETIKRGREREKDRIAVERAIREARERAFAEARERAERAAVERAAAEARQRVMAEAREKNVKASIETKPSAYKASKLRAERAAVERATAEARERALEKAMSQKTSMEARGQAAKTSTERFSSSSRNNGLKQSSDLEKFDGATSESAQRRKARLERHQRIMERAAKALAEKNMRDLLAQKEQAERNRLAESLDADIKRWATGKEGNLRALLSTLQYILGPDSGWQPVPLTEIVTTAAVKKAYRKATLCVHPDKLQQRGANIQQKYVCEKIFDLLKAGWNRFNSEES